MKRVLIGCMGLGDAIFSEGIRDGVNALAARLNVTGKVFTHRDGSKILRYLKDQKPDEVYMIGHSMGVNTLDSVAEKYAGTIDAVFSVASAYPEKFPSNVKKVFWVTGDKDWRQFTIEGEIVHRVKINASHITVDNDKGLWSLVEAEIRGSKTPAKKQEGTSSMKTSLKGKMAIMVDEGVVLSRYKDAVGVWTIGVGHTKNAGPPDPASITYKLTFAQVMEIFTDDLAKFEARVNAAVKVPLTQAQFDALVSFDFNTGAIHKASLVRKLNGGDYAGAAQGLLAWNKAGGKVLSALTHRRKKEKALFERGVYGEFIANFYPATPAGKVEWSKAQRVNLQTLLTSDGLTAGKPVEKPPAPKAPVKPSPVPKPTPEPVKKPESKNALVLLAAALAAATAGVAATWERITTAISSIF